MRNVMFAILLMTQAVTGAAAAVPRVYTISTGSELRTWCEAQSKSRLLDRGVTPYNWSASFWQDGNSLLVKGSWRVDTSSIEVDCQVKKGGRNLDASLSLR